MTMNAEKVAVVCKALGDANRLEIVQMLSDGEKCGCKILERFEITQPTLSQWETSYARYTRWFYWGWQWGNVCISERNVRFEFWQGLTEW